MAVASRHNSIALGIVASIGRWMGMPILPERGLAVPALPALGLGLCTAVVVLAVAALGCRARPREATEGASVDTG